MKTYDDIITARQNEIFNEVQDIEVEIQTLTARLEFLKARKQNRIEEHQMLQNVQDRGLLAQQPTNGRVARIHIEDALKKIFDNAGRPMSVSEIFNGLENFGYQWSSYQSAYQRVVKGTDLLESAGARGYYQLIRFR